MKNYNRISKRLLACLLTLAMIVSAFSGAFGIISSALTEGTDYTISNSTSVSSDTVTKGAATIKFYDGTNYNTISGQNPSAINDGNFASSSQFEAFYAQAPFFSLKDGCQISDKTYSSIDQWYVGGERYLDVILPLEDNASIENIVLVNHSNANLMIGNFEVYASDSPETLFNGANLIKDVDNKTAKQQVYNFTFAEGKELTGKKYVGLRITNPVTDVSESALGGLISSNNCNIIYTRLFEFNVFGTAVKTEFKAVIEDNRQEMPSNIDSIAVSSLESKFYKDGVETFSASNSSNSNLNNMIDGSVSEEGQFMHGDFLCTYFDMDTGVEHSTDGKYYQDFIYTIKKDFVINDIVVINHETADLKTGKYKIFFSNDKDTLFSNPEKSFLYENTGNYRRQVIEVNGEEGFSYKYAGVRVIDPVQDIANFGRPPEYAVVRVFELNFYGSSTSSSSEIATTVTKDNNTTLPAGDNIVAGMVPNSVHYADGAKVGEAYNTITASASDADPTTLVHTGGNALCAVADGSGIKFLTEADGCYTDLYYNLGAKATISSVLIFNHSDSRIRMNEFKLYVSDSEAELYKSASFVGTYSTEGKLRNVIEFDTPVKGKYVGIRATDVTFNKTWTTTPGNVYLRLADFCVFGEKPVISNKITLASSNNDATCILDKTGAVSSMKQYYINPTTGTREPTGTYTTALDENNQTRSALDVLTDNVMNKEVEFSSAKFAVGNTLYTDGTAALDIVYALDGRTDISDIVVVNHKDNVWKSSYDLYMSDSEATLFDEENKVYSFENFDSKERTQHYTAKDMSFRYVGMRVFAATTVKEFGQVGYAASVIYPRIFQFNVYGEKSANQSLANIKEADSTAIPEGTSVVTSASAKYYNGSASADSALANADYLFDEDIATAGNVFTADASAKLTADSGKYYDLILKLTRTSVVNDIFVFADANPDNYPQKYKVYASTNLNKLFDDESLIAEYENVNSKRAQTFSVPSISATHVAIRVYSAGKNADSVLKLLEFNVFGTPGEVIDDSVDAGTYIPENNFLLNMMPAVEYTTAVDKYGRSPFNAASITDGDAENALWHIGAFSDTLGKEFVQKNPSTGLWEVKVDGTVYCDVSFDLGGTATLDKVYVAHHSGLQIRTKWFSVYASTDRATLYNEENLIKEVKNNSGFRANLIALDTPLEGIRAIGIRIYDPCFDYTSGTCALNQDELNQGITTHNNIYPRLAEIAACGSFEKDPFVIQKETTLTNTIIPSEFDIKEEENLSKNVVISGKFVDTYTGTSSAAAYNKPQNLNDGILTNECEVTNRFAAFENGSAKYYNLEGRYYLEMRYDFQQPANLKYLVLANHSSAELVTGKFEVFTGNEYETIYDSPAYVEVNNIEQYKAGKSARVNIITFDETVEPARYVIVRIWDPVCATEVGSAMCTDTTNNIYPRIFEYSVYGKYVDPNFVPEGPKEYPTTEGVDLSTIENIYGVNLIKGQAIGLISGGIRKGNSVEEKKGINALYDVINKDGTGTMHCDIGGGIPEHTSEGKPLDFFWKLGNLPEKPDIYRVNGFAFQGISSNSTPYYQSHYAIYVAEEQEDLWLDSSRVFEYNAATGSDKIQKGVIYEFPKDKAVLGNYIGMRIYKSVYTATQHVYPRISFFHVWGEGGEVIGYPGNLAENMPINPNYIDGSEKTEISESNLSAKETANLTDSNEKTSAKISTNGKDIELLYNLCGDMKIDSIWASALINSGSGFKKMKVYASDSWGGVNDESSLIWTYDVGSKKGTVKPEKTFKKQLKARYIRFLFEDTKDTLVINEIYVNGLDNQKNKTRTLTNNSTESDITIQKINLKTGDKSYINPAKVGAIIDSDARSSLEIRDGGIVGENTYEITLAFTDLRTISRIQLNFPKYFEQYWAKKINVYIYETFEASTDKSVKPTFVVKAKDVNKDGVYAKQLRPVLGRFIKLEFVDFNKNEIYINEDGKQEIVTLFNDIKVTGTKVKGMNADETTTALVDLTDANSIGGVIVNRLDLNDIFTDAVSVKLTPEKATNWQMLDLQTVPYLEVVKKTNYKVEILDLYGNPVNNFGGRTLTMKMKLPSGADGSKYMIGDASERASMTGLDSYAVNGYVYANYTWKPGKDNKIALLKMTTEEDPYWDTIGEREDFSEGVIRDPLKEMYPDSIITTDHRFIVTGVYDTFKSGTKFTATDISYTVDESVLRAALELDPTKVVAVAYDMELTNQGAQYDLNGNFVEITMNLPAFLYNNYTDFVMVHIDETGYATMPWSGVDFMDDKVFRFQTDSFSKFVILANRNDGDFVATDMDNNGVSPETGESFGSVAAALLSLAAAAYVAMNFRKKKEEN